MEFLIIIACFILMFIYLQVRITYLKKLLFIVIEQTKEKKKPEKTVIDSFRDNKNYYDWSI